MAESEKRAVARAAGITGIATLASRIMGFLRDMVIAAFFGTTMGADAFFVAFRIPNLMRRLLAEGSLSMAFVPVFNAVLEKDGKEEAFVFARSCFRILGLVLIGIVILGVFGAPVIVEIIAPGFSEIPEKMELTIFLTRLTFPYVFFICLVALAMGILNSLGHFAIPALSPAILNACMILAVFIFAGHVHPAVTALAIGVIFGGIFQFTAHFPILWKKGFRFFGAAPWVHPAVRQVAKLWVPTIFGAAVYQVSIVIGTILASFLESGSVSYLYYADRLVQFPLAIFGISAATAVLPTLSRQVASGRMEDMQSTFMDAIRWMLFINFPAMVGLMVLAHPLVTLLFQRGAFGAHDSLGTAIALVCYSFGLWAFACVRVAVSVFYAAQDTRTPVIMGAVSLGIGILLSLILMGPFSYGGLALATSLGSMANFLLLSWKLSKKYPGIFSVEILKGASLSFLNALLMGVIVYGTDYFFFSHLPHGKLFLVLRVLCGIFLGIAAYGGFAWLLGSRELKMGLDWLRRKGR